MGVPVTLISGFSREQPGTLQTNYGIATAIRHQPIHTITLPPNWPNQKRIKSLLFLPGLLWQVVRHRLQEEVIIYSREDHFAGYLLLALRLIPGIRAYFEAHYFPPTRRNLWWQLKMDGIVTINPLLREAYLAAGSRPEKTAVVPDGVDITRFSPQMLPGQARSTLGFSEKRPLLIYSGHLFAWKGVYTLIEAMSFLADVDCMIVGGLAADVAAVQQYTADRQIKNVALVGQVAPTAVPSYLWAADVLVLPNSGKNKISQLYTSPLKLFEYMAAGRPIIASDLPSLHQVLTHGRNAHLVAPDNPRALADGVLFLLNNKAYAAQISQQAQHDVQAYSWDQRAQRIVEFLEQPS